MNDPQASENGTSLQSELKDRLDSWKKIASYLRRDVSTVQRWERREAMPVHRHQHDKLGSVFAYRSELDTWWEGRRTRLAQESAGEAAPRARPGVLWRWALAAGLLVVAGTLTWLAVERAGSWRNPLANAKFTPLSEFAGTEQAAEISRDGKLVAFLASRDGRTDAWVGEIGSGAYRNLTHGDPHELVNPSIRTLGFSADSSLVSVWTRKPEGSQPGDVNVFAAPVTGGPLRLYLREAAEFDWSRDGKRLVYHTTAPGDPMFVRESGSSLDRRIYVAPAGVHCHYPVWAPDDAFIYFVRGVPPDDWDIWRIRPSGAGLERVTNHNARVSYPVILDPRTLIYLATDADGSGPWIYGVDVERRIPHRISTGVERYKSLAASADGTRLVATAAFPRTSVWRASPASDRTDGTPANGPSLVWANGVTPRLGPGFMVFKSTQGGKQGIWTQTQGATREVWSSAHSHIVGAPAIAPDGRRIAFTVEDGGRTRLLTMDKDGSHVRVLADSLELRGSPVWSPDGQSVISAAVSAGEPRLTRIFLNGDSPAPLVSEYSIDPVWSPDGRFLVYSGADVGTTFPVRAAAADGRPYPMPSVMLTRGARRVAFLRGQHTLVILRGEIGRKNFWIVDLQTGGERELIKLPPDFVIGDFDVSPDGSEIVFDRVEETSDLALIERMQ